MAYIIIMYLLLSAGLPFGASVLPTSGDTIPNACAVKDDPRFPDGRCGNPETMKDVDAINLIR